MSLYDVPVHTLDGSSADLHDYDGKVALIVNVASKCGLTPQYETLEKIDVNGEARHPLYAQLTETPDDEGAAGDIQWNFEKFLVGTDGTIVKRFRPGVVPDDPAVIGAIEANLPS